MTGSNRSSPSLKNSKRVKSDWLLGIKKGNTSLFCIKKGENCQKHTKNTIFFNESLIFLSNLLKSRANHSHHSFLKSDKSDSLLLLFCKELHVWILWRSLFCKERQERMAYSCFLQWGIYCNRKSKEGMSEFPTQLKYCTSISKIIDSPEFTVNAVSVLLFTEHT